MAGAPGEKAGSQQARLSRDLSELLLELSIGAHRYAMYPPGHPSLAPIVENIIGHLGEIFDSGREQLSVGVARRQLVIEGVATDAGHPVLGDLARRLHEHQISALVFSRGAQARDIEGLLEALSADPGRDADPVGLLPPEELPSWEHVRIVPIGYERLALREDEGEEKGTDPAQELWLGLAQAALAVDGAVDEETAEDAGGLARSIREHSRDAGYDEVIVGYLRRLAEELRDRETGEAARVRDRMSALIRELDQDTLSRMVELGSTREDRRSFLLNANQGLAVDAVVKVLRAAATSEGKGISDSLTRMLTKLSVHANEESSARAKQADTALRDNVERLIDSWDLEDPNPDQYTSVLDAMATASPLFERDDDTSNIAGPERLVKMALEVDAWGMTVKKAVTELLDREMSGVLLSLVEGAGRESRAAAEIRSYLASPTLLRRLLAGRDVDESGLNALVDDMGEVAIDPLLSVLADSDSRSVRRKVFDALGRLGPEVAVRAMERLEDPRWFVVRNMLALLGRLKPLPEGLDLERFMRHSDARVRREAFTLAFKEGDTRARTLALALGEEDERLIRMALLEIRPPIPETLVPTVVNRVLNDPTHSPDIRAMAARTLAGSRSSLARDALVRTAAGGKTLFGRVRVAERSPEVLAALRVLAGSWRTDGEARPILDAAERSKDAEIREAAGVGA